MVGLHAKLLPGIVLLLLLVFSNAYTGTNSCIGIKEFVAKKQEAAAIDNLQLTLLKRLSYELLPRGITPVLIDSMTPNDCIAVAYGFFELQEGEPVLRFILTGLNGTGDEVKIIPLSDRSNKELLDILSLKIRHFLEQNISGKLRISSTPLGCNILLNGIKIGATPAELILEQGAYAIRLEGDYLSPYFDSIRVQPGGESVIAASMQFQGYRTAPWLTSAALFSLCSVAGLAIETYYHKQYNSISKNASQNEYNHFYERYRIANYCKIGFLNAAALSWTIYGYQFARNRTIEKKIFGRK